MAPKRKVTDSNSAMHVKRKALEITNANDNTLLNAYPPFQFHTTGQENSRLHAVSQPYATTNGRCLPLFPPSC